MESTLITNTKMPKRFQTLIRVPGRKIKNMELENKFIQTLEVITETGSMASGMVREL